MKKALISGFLGIVFALSMAACGGNATETDTTVNDTCGATMQNEQCMKHCQMTCLDSVCLAANCENCACPDSSACHQKPACKGDGNCCKKAEGEGCQKAEGECCKKDANAEACKKECEKKNK